MERILDDEYKGARWTYAMKYRPLGGGAQPAEGQILGSYKPTDKRGRYGTLQYVRELTVGEIENMSWFLYRR